MIRIPASLIEVGKRLVFDVFDERKRIMLMRGTPIKSDETAERIRQFGYRMPPRRKIDPVFNAMASLAERLAQMEEDIRLTRPGGAWTRRLENLSQDLILVSDTDPNAAFAACHLDCRHSYFVFHSLMVALLCSRLALSFELPPSIRHSIVGAGLTHDFALAPIRYALDASRKLTGKLQLLVEAHPRNTVALLQDFGLKDPLWLEAVRDHHERLNGSGYAGKKGYQIGTAARILAVADSYSAMLRPRPYRAGLLAGEALDSMYGRGAEIYDLNILAALVWDFGFHPPGSVLRLANGDVAVAVRNTPGLLDNPLVATVLDSSGAEIPEPIFRDSRDPDFAITEALLPEQLTAHDRIVEKCWQPPTVRWRSPDSRRSTPSP